MSRLSENYEILSNGMTKETKFALIEPRERWTDPPPPWERRRREVNPDFPLGVHQPSWFRVLPPTVFRYSSWRWIFPSASMETWFLEAMFKRRLLPRPKYVRQLRVAESACSSISRGEGLWGDPRLNIAGIWSVCENI